MSENKLKTSDFSVIDLFCGVGGLTHGFVKEKFKVDAGIDFDISCKYAFENNNSSKFYHEDITKLSGEELNEKFKKGKKKILIGCAPCQPFSKYNSKSSINSKIKEDDKWKLLYSFSNLIDEVEPEIISMENVPQLVKFDNGKVFNDFVSRLESKQYYVSWEIVNAQDFGVPQRRKRLVLLASKLGEIKLIDKTIKNNNYKTVRSAIGHLPKIEDGSFCPNDILHRARKLTPINKRRIKATKEGGSWRDWDEDLKLACHKKESGKDFGSVYGRMKWDEVSPTMTTYCTGLSNGRFGHPEQDRAISLREAAILQSFPETYKFIAPDKDFSVQALARHIGNAVPVKLGVAIAKSIKNHINKFEK